jgi:hypothetical protein
MRNRALEIAPTSKVKTIAITDPKLIARVQTEAAIQGTRTTTKQASALILLGIRLIDLQRTYGNGELTQREIYAHTKLLIDSTIGFDIGTPDEAARIAGLLQNEQTEEETETETETA